MIDTREPKASRSGRRDVARIRRAAWPVALALGVLVLAPVVAKAQTSDDVRALLDRMERLERDIRTLNFQVSRGGPAPVQAPGSKPVTAGAVQPPSAGPGADAGNPAAVARINVRMAQLETDLRAATGAMEELGHDIKEIRDRLDKLVADVDFRLSALERRAAGTPGPTQPGAPAGPPKVSAAPSPPSVEKIVPGQLGTFAQAPRTLGTVSEKAVAAVKPPAGDAAAPKSPPAGRVAAAPAAPPPRPAAASAPPLEAGASGVLPAGTPKERYGYAFGLLRQANYDQAETAFQEFVKLHPDDPLASNARYWLGETYYVRAAYVEAAEVFLEGYKADPKGAKAADSLLKLGMSLAALDKKREACAAFDRLLKDFPKASAGVKNTVSREKQKHGCE